MTSAARAEHATSWRASSWDLLNGLVVRDVSDTIPARTFDALFSDRGLGPAAATQPMHEHAGVLGHVSAGGLLVLIARVGWAKLARR